MTEFPLDDLGRMINTRPPACGSTRVVAIDGHSGSGKTELAGNLAEILGAPILHLEDIYPGWRGLESAIPYVQAAFSELAADRTGHVPRWNWETNRFDGEITCLPVPTLIVEGCGSGARVLRPFLSFLLWVDSAEDVRKERVLSRDGGIYAPYWDIWAAQEEAHYTREGTRWVADAVATS